MKNGHDRTGLGEVRRRSSHCLSYFDGADILERFVRPEVAMVRYKVEQHVPNEIIEAGERTAKALRELEQGWQRAQDVIGQRAGLRKGASGSWGEPANAAA
jgi:hypothetical protein